MTRFSGKVVLVTGSSNGIGRATALLFAKEGAKVTITGRNSQRLEETKREILKVGTPEDHVLVVVTDLTDEKGQDELVNSTIEKFGRLDVLVNNAGTGFVDSKGRIGLDQDINDFNKSMDINTRCVITLTQKAKKYLMETKGEVINVSSVAAGPQAHADFMYYSMAKAALEQFTRCAAIDLIQYGIRVNSVSLGLVKTGFGATLGMSDEVFEKMIKSMESRKYCVPCGKVAQPTEVANIILFLADRKLSSYIVGQSIVADGGCSLVMGMHAFDTIDILSS
ncbi:unnamed protein product [Caenorhabditis brenneri]